MVQKAKAKNYRKGAFNIITLLLLFASFFTTHLSVKGQQARYFNLPSGITPSDYAPDVVVVKLRDEPSSSNARTLSTSSSTSLDKIRQLSKAKIIEPVVHQTINATARKSPAKSTLDNIYKIHLSEGEEILPLINRLLKLNEVVYAEPYYLMKPLREQKMLANGYIPNDPEATPGRKQHYLKTVHAYEAWEIEKGNPDVLIGILDTGVGLGHQDLMDNLKYNPADPVNGVDDDKDGYVDNYMGWDMADRDNDPTADRDKHGTLVAGVAAATTDNGLGIAGAGFNSSYMPVKVFSSASGLFYRGYEAIVYAADHGCKVINLSWGAPNAYSSFGQDIISYAVLEKDVVVVAAAGNSGRVENFYPASYDHVLSVAISDVDDNKISQTTHNYFVDIMAPGANTYTTDNHDTYSYASGSSLSAPLVAGAAALVRAKYPEMSALQVMEKLRLSTDNVYAVGNNAGYSEQLGYGRLNMKKALLPLNSPGIRMLSVTHRNPIGVYAFAGDSLKITTTFTNYFKPSSAAKVTLTALSPYATVIDSVLFLGAVDSLALVNNIGDEFTVLLSDNLPVNEKMMFRLGIEDGSYYDYQYFTLTSSPDYLVVNNGKMQVSVGSAGAIAYNPGEAFGGTGLLFKGISLTTQMGLVIAADTTKVSDNTILNLLNGGRSRDFSKLESIKVSLSETHDLVTYSSFSDESARYPLNVRIEQQWLAHQGGDGASASSGNYLVAEYRVIGLSSDTLKNLHTGLFADWDLGDWKKNRANWDAEHQLGYVYDGSTFAGVALLSSQQVTHHAVDWKGLNGNIAEIGDIFTDTERFKFLANTTKLKAGEQGTGNDVAYMVGGKTDAIGRYQAQTFAFAIVAANSLTELQQAVRDAAQQYKDYRSHPPISHAVYVCQGKAALIAPDDGSMFRFYSDPLGTKLLHEGQSYTTDPVQQDMKIYFTNIDKGYESKISCVKIELQEPLAKFSFTQNDVVLSGDTLFIDESENYTITLNNLSEETDAWEWNLGNGFKSTKQHPITYYKPGRYTVMLKAFNKAGCADALTKTLVVLRRSPAPVIPHAYICQGSEVTLVASNASQLQFYADAAMNDLVHQGSSFTTGALSSDTSFYVVSTDAVYASLPHKVDVTMVMHDVAIEYALDTLSLSPRYALRFKAVGSLSNITDIQWYVDNVKVATDSNFVYDYAVQHAQNSTIAIRLDYTVSDHGTSCRRSIRKTIELIAQDMPVLSFAHDCQTNQGSIVPQEGLVFYFYENKELDSVIYKGRQLLIDAVSNTKTYYITHMDGLRESPPTAFTVGDGQLIDFSMSTDTIYLSGRQEVSFEAFYLSEDHAARVGWLWDVGNGKFVAKPYKFSHLYDSAATYAVRLKAKTSTGCEYVIEKRLVVQSVMNIAEQPANNGLHIYPVPSYGKITIEHKQWSYEPVTVRILTFEGKVLYSSRHMYNKGLQIDFSENIDVTAPQLYMLQLETSEHSFFQKVLFMPAM